MMKHLTWNNNTVERQRGRRWLPCSGSMTTEEYFRKIVPVAALFAVSLWLSNSAYLYLSVAFIQMVKAQMPCVVRRRKTTTTPA